MKTKNTRNTAARSEIEQLLTESKTALSPAELKDRMTESCDRVTVYRILDRLTGEGLVHKVMTADGAVRYAVCHSCSDAHSHDHIHFSCEQCHLVTCLEEVKPTYQLPKDYTVREMQFTLSGICRECSDRR
ncbi:Fur family transcriptional regulator [Chryseobacterium sp. Leaf180]|uniref:Fur family transcriptional regulator n=1 Tax=Chryseobacterium sp. Leaf180 TaxID=1736289 RepID=UPI0006F62BD2|nr:transcriptional repressor [Chryseobacterium sp. Leaf180]KQR94439.1 Fur family transcriptional regulator [Chryseobacterium sp. Leaf180]